jgi:hypothetical protein
VPYAQFVPSLLPWLAALASCFTAPSFQTFVHVVTGWIVCLGRHQVTQVLCAAGALGVKHHSTFHRFFRQARWVPDEIGLCLLRLVMALLPAEAPVVVAVDDTLGRHTGKHIRGAAMHHDPLLSTRAKAFHHWGHVWVVLAVVVEVPHWHKRFALPVLCRLYRTEKTCAAAGRPFATKTALARDLIALVAQALPTRTLYVVGDNAYTNQVTRKSLPAHAHLIGRASMTAALFAPPAPRPAGHRGGRPRQKGDRVPSPAARAAAPTGWQTRTVEVYGRQVAVQVKIFDALWSRAAGGRLRRFVLVRGWPGHDKDDVLVGTDLTLDAAAIITRYCQRWSIEVTFEEVEGKRGFEDPQNRTDRAVERTAPMALWVYVLTVLWYLDRCGEHGSPPLPQRPWYTKEVPAFSDMLAALRLTIWHAMIGGEAAQPSARPKCFEAWLLQIAYAT